jgi:hypothetical protein
VFEYLYFITGSNRISFPIKQFDPVLQTSGPAVNPHIDFNILILVDIRDQDYNFAHGSKVLRLNLFLFDVFVDDLAVEQADDPLAVFGIAL